MCRLAAAALAIGWAAGFAGSALGKERPAVTLSAEEIVAKNVAARGGQEAWRRIQTMTWIGHIESAHVPVPHMRFMLEQKRPNKTRFELNTMSEKTVRVFDGAQGWMERPLRNGLQELQAYTSEELRFAQAGQGIDGPLIDHAAKGNVVSVEGLDEIEGHKCYRLEVRLASGERDRLWVDAKTFLEIRYDRFTAGPVRLLGRVMSVVYRDYKSFDGVKMPTVIERSAEAGDRPDRMVIEQVALNSPLDNSTFAKPGTARRRSALHWQPRELSGVHEGLEAASQ